MREPDRQLGISATTEMRHRSDIPIQAPSAVQDKQSPGNNVFYYISLTNGK